MTDARLKAMVIAEDLKAIQALHRALNSIDAAVMIRETGRYPEEVEGALTDLHCFGIHDLFYELDITGQVLECEIYEGAVQ